MAAFRCILVGGLDVYISHYFKYNGTIKTVGGWRGGQHRLYIVIYSVQKKKLAVSEGGGLAGGAA